MKILVAVKRVVDAKIKVRPLPDHSGVDVKLAKMAMNPFDEIAIEKAVTLREAGVADEVVAVTVGPLKAVDTLRVAMAIGADRAVHVRTDESLEPLAVAKVLRAVVEREKPDLVLLGKQAIDDDANQTGQMLSALCDMPLATFANCFRLQSERRSPVGGGVSFFEFPRRSRVRCRTFFLNGCRAQGPRLRFSRVPSFPRR